MSAYTYNKDVPTFIPINGAGSVPFTLSPMVPDNVNDFIGFSFIAGSAAGSTGDPTPFLIIFDTNGTPGIQPGPSDIPLFDKTIRTDLMPGVSSEELTWQGVDNIMQPLNDGVYTVYAAVLEGVASNYEIISWPIAMVTIDNSSTPVEVPSSGINEVKVIMNGQNYTSYPVEITPDNDNDSDFLQFSFQAGGSHSYAIVVDTNANNVANPITDWSQQDGKDWTFRDYAPAGSTRFIQWEGRDSKWQVLPNGIYKVWIYEDTHDNNFASGTTVNDEITVTVTTKYITGTVATATGSPIANAMVNAGGTNGCGQAYTNSQGVYVISGLKAGTYNVRAEKDGYFCSEDSTNNANIELSGAYALKNLTMEPSIQVPLTISLPSTFTLPEGQYGSLWLNIDARNTLGAGWSHSQGSINNGEQSTQVNLNLQSLADGQNWNVVITGEFWYWDNVNQHEVKLSYAGNASFTKAYIDANGSVPIALSKACSVTGTLALPFAATSNLNINVRLQNVNNPSLESWGWGQVQSGQSTGSFYLSSVPNGTYRAIIQVDGFKSTTSSEFTVASSDVTLTQVTMDAGLSITGTIHLGRAYEEPKTLWINAWAQNDYNCHNTQVTIEAGSQDASFTLSGLENLSYEIWTWMDGAEFTVNGGKPYENKIPAGTVDVALALTPYSGIISGIVTAPAGVTLTNVVISALSLWDGTSGNASTSFAVNADGTYSIDYLSTGEYMIVANEFSNPDSNPLIPTGNTALFSQTVFVKNGEATGLTINLQSPYFVRGTVSGDSDILANQLIAVALPMNIAMKGGSNMDGGMIMAPVNPSNYHYRLALGEGTYAITIIGFDESGASLGFACDRKIKVVNSDMTGVNFSVSDGYAANISVNLPSAVALDEGMSMNFLGGMELYKGETKIGDNFKEVMIGSESSMGSGSTGMSNMSFVEPGSSSFSLAFEHLAPGNYTARFFSPYYVMGSKSFTVVDTNVNTSMTLSTGGTITGRIVDAASGTPIYQNVVVSCEAIPWVDGSYRSTEWDPNGAFSNSTKKFQLRNLPEGTYIVRVEYSGSSTSNVNYADASIFGVSVTGTDSFDLGTIKLNQGTTISGRITSGGAGIPNMLVVAKPTDSKYGKASAEAKTDSDGYYTISGIDPEKPYWKVIAAVRPDAWDFMAQQPDYGEEVLNNVAPGAENIDFTLTAANATLAGTITIPDGKTFSLPFSMGDYPMPSALILLQKKGRVYAQPMDGLQVMSNPSNGTTATYNVSHLTPGTYRIMVVCNGVSTYINPSLTIGEGSNTLNVELPAGATVSGSVTKADGSYPTTNDLDLPVAMNLLNGELVFGTFTKDSGTGQISAYSISGLKPGYEYRVSLVSPGDNGPGTIYVQTPGDNSRCSNGCTFTECRHG